ncbi:hypothetical protein C4D60_Mb08t19400 [Musa balbisiana]|uniref:Uncharacterized protein n=1 Tax=Musa balbisiana TaxID=52838 RepID=A0A4S8K4W9_MUSBA|nr:hypothetical protein C4D60_Mb08t19400 [Musa balbisiana]
MGTMWKERLVMSESIIGRKGMSSDPSVVEKPSVRPVTTMGETLCDSALCKPGVIDFSTNGEQTLKNIGVNDGKSNGTEHTGHQREGVSCDEKPKPVCMMKSQRPPVTEINQGTIDDEKTASFTPGDQRRHGGKRSAGTNDENFVEENIAIRESRSRIGDYGKLLPRSSNGLRRHTSRHTAALNDCQYDEEEMAVEKLLLYYSRKGRARDPIKERTTANHVDLDRFERPANSKIQLIQRRAVPPPERAISMPSEPVSPAEVKAPARSTSMQPDPSNPKVGRVHPKLPEFDQLAARLAATKKT